MLPGRGDDRQGRRPGDQRRDRGAGQDRRPEALQGGPACGWVMAATFLKPSDQTRAMQGSGTVPPVDRVLSRSMSAEPRRVAETYDGKFGSRMVERFGDGAPDPTRMDVVEGMA